MLDCFDGLISLDKTCTGGSGVLPLQTLDGINESMLKDMTGPEDTVASMLAECETWARAHIHNDVVTHFGSRIIARTFMDRKIVGEPDEEQELVTGETGLGGILIEIDQPRSNAVLRLGRLGLFGNYTGDVTLTIYDLEDGSIAATYDIDVVAGVSKTDNVQITLPAYRKRKMYFVCHDLPQYYRTWTNGGCGSCGVGYAHGGVRVTGARLPVGMAKKKTNLRLNNDTSGIMAVVTVECDHAQMLCEVRDALKLPYLYKYGEAIMRRGIYAVDRMNNQRLNVDFLKEKAAYYAEEYRSQLNKTLGKMRLPDDPMCFTCVKNASVFIAIP